MRLLIKNGYVIDEKGNPFLLDVLVGNGVILKVGKLEESLDAYTIDANKNYVLPGFIDMNCNTCDPGYKNKEDIISVSKSAAKGGFTSITCGPNTQPVVDNKTVVSYITSKTKANSLVNIYVYGSMSEGCEGKKIAEIGTMRKSGIVAVSDGNETIDNTALMRNILLYSKMFDMPVITSCSDRTLVGKGVMNSGKVSTQMGLIGIPREAEEIIVARNIILAEHTGAKLHLSSITTEGSVNLVRYAKERGVNVTCETQPHYFTLTEESVLGYNTINKTMPPLRTADDIEAIKKGLADGIIDVISSGHSPETIESKEVEFNMASNGISSVETMFSISYKYLVESGYLTLPQLINKISYTPAKILNLQEKGLIKENYDADIVIMDINTPYNINPREFASKAKYSPYKGEEVKGSVIYNMVEGNVVYLK